MKKLGLLSLAIFMIASSTLFAAKKGITKRKWLVYNALSENGNDANEPLKTMPIVTLAFKDGGGFEEQIAGKVGDRMILPGKWSWNKKPQTANGKKCINLSFAKMSNASPSRKVYAAVDVDYGIIKVDYNFVGHDQPYTGYAEWNARVTLNEMLGHWKISFDKQAEGWPAQEYFIDIKDKNLYALYTADESFKEEGTWSFKNNYIDFTPGNEDGLMKGLFIEPAYYNAKSRDIKILLADGIHTDCYLHEAITKEQIIGKWMIGELEMEFTKSQRFKISNKNSLSKYIDMPKEFEIFSWKLEDNTVYFYPSEDKKCDDCVASAKINLYNDGRELTFGDMDYETGKWTKQF